MGRRLGELLVAEGRISEGVLARALELQGNQARGQRLGAILLRWGLVPESVLLEALSAHHRCAAVDWATLSAANKESLKLLSSAQSTRLGAVPYSSDRKSVRVAFANPSNLAAIDEVQAITGKRVIPSVTTEVRLLQAQQRFYQRPLTRDVWTIVQRIERPAPPAPPAPAAASVDPPAPEPLWIGKDEGAEESRSAAPVRVHPIVPAPVSKETTSEDPAIEDLLEPAPGPGTDPIESPKEPIAAAHLEMAEQTIPIFPQKVADFEGFDSFLEGLRLGDLIADRLDPFADDTPLADFIEQALSFYEAHPTFRSALAALDEGAIEDLDGEIEGEPIPPRGFPLDSTQPSPRHRQDDAGAEQTF